MVIKYQKLILKLVLIINRIIENLDFICNSDVLILIVITFLHSLFDLYVFFLILFTLFINFVCYTHVVYFRCINEVTNIVYKIISKCAA